MLRPSATFFRLAPVASLRVGLQDDIASQRQRCRLLRRLYVRGPMLRRRADSRRARPDVLIQLWQLFHVRCVRRRFTDCVRTNEVSDAMPKHEAGRKLPVKCTGSRYSTWFYIEGRRFPLNPTKHEPALLPLAGMSSGSPTRSDATADSPKNVAEGRNTGVGMGVPTRSSSQDSSLERRFSASRRPGPTRSVGERRSGTPDDMPASGNPPAPSEQRASDSAETSSDLDGNSAETS